jgi:antitoxin Phd
MTTATAIEVQTRFGEYVDRAQQEPVSIKKNGRKYAVLLSQAEYERLQASEDRYWGMMALEAKKSGMLTPEETTALLSAEKE